MNYILYRKAADTSTFPLAKLGKDEKVSMAVLERICDVLNCNIGDVMDFLPDGDEKK